MMPKHILVAAGLGALLAAGSAAAMPNALTADQLFDFCRSSTISEAATRGDQLGWQRLSDAQLEEWRTKFISHNGGSVEVVGWRPGAEDAGTSLSFWIAEGPNGQRVCSYSTTDPAWLLNVLSARFGAPDKLDKHDFGATAYWKQGLAEVSFSQVGSNAVVYISRLGSAA